MLDLHKILRQTYSGIFQRGFTLEELQNSVPEDQRSMFVNHPLLIPCLNDATKLQFNALSKDDLLQSLLKIGMSQNTASSVAAFSEGHAWESEELSKKLSELIPDFPTLIDIWENTPLKQLKLTSLGIAVGYCNARRTIASWAGDLSIWIK